MGGSCVSYPSQTFACDSPPPATCIGGTQRTFASAGTCSGGVCSYTPTDTVCANGCAGGSCIACVAGNPCTGNPGAPCRAGVTTCPGGPNSLAVCSDGANTTSDCGGVINTSCNYAGNFCANTGSLVGQQQTCSGGTCSGTRPVSFANHPSCNRNQNGLVCQTTGGCTGGEINCVCRQLDTYVCNSGSCNLDSTTTVTCGTMLCMTCAIE
jgi:hypothetical protein